MHAVIATMMHDVMMGGVSIAQSVRQKIAQPVKNLSKLFFLICMVSCFGKGVWYVGQF
jgi:hypothetical protein